MKYYLGLDIGTTSVGWAVTDENMNLLRKKGQDLWGVRLFESADSAADRRLKRSARRNRARKKLMTRWLEELFADEINKVDPNFFLRLHNSALFFDDKDDALGNEKYSLFSMKDKSVNEIDFYKKYPTMYHLREKLLKSPAEDVRLLYLAVHHIIKSRGHFLVESQMGGGSFVETYNSMLELLQEAQLETNLININSADEYLSKLKGWKIREAKEETAKLIGATTVKDKLFANAIIDGKFKLKDLLKDTDIDLTEEEIFEVPLYDQEKYDVVFPLLTANLSEDLVSVIEKLKELHSIVELKKIIKDHDYISQAMVDSYEVHKQDLKQLKKFVREYYPAEYKDLFRMSYVNSNSYLKTNYSIYVGRLMVDGKKFPIGVNLREKKDGIKPAKLDRSIEALYDSIKKLLEKEPTKNDENYQATKASILEKIENGNYLLKQKTKNNVNIPNALLKSELEKILEVNATKYTFLNEEDEYGTTIDKILKIMTFRVPYFVGPISSKPIKEGGNRWSEVNNNIAYYPWTINKIVDFNQSEEKFIRRMTNKCTYLTDEDVLPKNSIIFSKFKVLNELNNLRVNGDRLSVANKQRIYENLFMTKPKVTPKALYNELVAMGYPTDMVIGGIDKEFKSNLSVLLKLKNILSPENYKNEKLLEDIVFYHTLIEDKQRVVNRLKEKYNLSEAELKSIKGLNYSGWGSLSEEFLMNLYFKDLNSNNDLNVMTALWNTNKNLQEIIYCDYYTLREELLARTQKEAKDLVYEDVENLYCSAPVKRSVWQTINVINELKNLMGEYPEKIFVEVTREDGEKGEKGRKLSRKKNLVKLFASKEAKQAFAQDKEQLQKLLKELNGKEESALRSDKLYLYFLQGGKCAYSGKTINISEIGYDTLDIDHIVPQSYIKDDSIENKVLVYKTYNEAKTDIYPFFNKFDWCKKVQDLWKIWVNAGLMSNRKYEKLTRTAELTAEDRAGFIARQLVETNQSAKVVIDLLRGFVKEDKDIVFSKASVVSAFRQVYDIPKSRDVNDLHHAKDAYLNIVCGNVMRHRFTDNPINFFREKSRRLDEVETNEVGEKIDVNKTTNPIKLFAFPVYSFSSKEKVWNGRSDAYKVANICNKNTCNTSKKTEYNINSGFYDETVYKSKINDPDTKAKVSLKGKGALKDYNKYGGYGSQGTAYFMIVKSTRRGKPSVTMERMTSYALKQIEVGLNTIEDYLKTDLGLDNAKIIVDKLPMYTELNINGGRYLLSSLSGARLNIHNFNQWFTTKYNNDYSISNNQMEKYIKLIAKYMDIKKAKIEIPAEYVTIDKIVISPAKSERGTEKALTRVENVELYNKIISQLKKPMYNNLLAGRDVVNKLVERKDMFADLSVDKQVECLNSIIAGVSTGCKSFDLSLIGGKKLEGEWYISTILTGKTLTIVNRSALGFVTKTKKLNFSNIQ